MFRIAFLSRKPVHVPEALSAIAEVTIVEVPEPSGEEVGLHFGHAHLWSARALDELRRRFPDRAPELIELCGSPADGVVTVQARSALDPWLRESLVLVRLSRSREIEAVLNGFLPGELPARLEFDLERYVLRHADRLLWPGGGLLEAFARLYGGELAPGARVPLPVLPAECGGPPPGEDELRLLYLGPLERADGVQELVRAAGWLERDDWRLTLAGADTRTGTLATSMRAQLELEIEGDERIALRDEPGPGEAVELIRAHDVVVVPGRWGGRPEAIVDALAQDRPVLATPAGSNAEVLGGAGWLADGETAEAIAASLDRLLERREPPARSPRSRFDELADPEPLLAAYADLAKPTRPARRPRRREQPLVSVVVPYFEVEAFVEETLRSIREQTYARLELLLVNDGSFREEDRFLDELAARYDAAVLTQPNRGVGAARNFGAAQSRGRYLCFLDSDNVVLPAFVERCVDVLEERPELGYATTWIRYVDEAGSPLPPPRDGYQPLSNECSMLSEINTAGDATALVRREVFDAGFRYRVEVPTHEDWLFYRQLAAAGIYGLAIPERLLHYRVREGSKTFTVGEPHIERVVRELAALEREQAVQWT